MAPEWIRKFSPPRVFRMISKNALTVNVTDYAGRVRPDAASGKRTGARIPNRTATLLDLLDDLGIRGTFFVSASIGGSHPDLLRRIRQAGHEVACYGDDPRRSRHYEDFRQQLQVARRVIEDCIGERVIGHRAPVPSIQPNTLWTLRILVEEGFVYDSSICPARFEAQGAIDAPRFPSKLLTGGGGIAEFPVSASTTFGIAVPERDRKDIRSADYRSTRNSLRELNRFHNIPAALNIHGGISELESREGHLTRRGSHEAKTDGRLRRLLGEFRFAPMAESLDSCPLRAFELFPDSPGEMFLPAGISFLNPRDSRTQSRKVSIIIPVFNEAGNLEFLCTELKQALEPLGVESEWIFVDDGSSDDSVARLLDLKHRFPPIQIIKLRRNFGQTAAMRAGFEKATGDSIVSMDADLQNDPADIPFLLNRLEEGYDLVCGWRRNRNDPLISRKLPSRIANWLIRKTIGSEIHDTGCSLKAYRAELVKALDLYSDMHRFIPAVSAMNGARLSELVVNHRSRKHGASKYGISRTFKVLSDLFALKLITRFGSKPLAGFFVLAFPFGLIGALSLLYTLWNRIGHQPHPLKMVYDAVALMLIATACFLLLLGLIGEVTISGPHASLKKRFRLICEEIEVADADADKTCSRD